MLTVVLGGAAEKNFKFSFVECVEKAGVKSGFFVFQAGLQRVIAGDFG